MGQKFISGPELKPAAADYNGISPALKVVLCARLVDHFHLFCDSLMVDGLCDRLPGMDVFGDSRDLCGSREMCFSVKHILSRSRRRRGWCKRLGWLRDRGRSRR